MDKILDVMEDIKQNITDSQYKIIMDSLMEFHKIENKWSEQKCVKINRLHNIMYPKYKNKHHINLPFLGRLREYM